jgi:predicted MFS family arabinose efflux permease
VLGGWLIDLGSWRAIFVINLPLAAAAIWLAWRYVPADRSSGGQRLDFAGGLCATLGLGALTWALTLASGRGGFTRSAAGLGAGGLLILALFVLLERQRGERAMMPLILFGSPSFIGLTLLTLFLYGAVGTVFVLMPYLLIEAAHYSAVAAGAALLPLPLILALISPSMGSFAARTGPRLPLTLGPLIVAAGFLLVLRIGGAAPYWSQVLPALTVMAFGMTAAVAPLTAAVLSSVDGAHTGVASGFNSAVARSGGLIGTALLGSVLASRGPELLAEFRLAGCACALACVAAAASAYFLLPAGAAAPAASGPQR